MPLWRASGKRRLWKPLSLGVSRDSDDSRSRIPCRISGRRRLGKTASLGLSRGTLDHNVSRAPNRPQSRPFPGSASSQSSRPLPSHTVWAGWVGGRRTRPEPEPDLLSAGCRRGPLGAAAPRRMSLVLMTPREESNAALSRRRALAYWLASPGSLNPSPSVLPHQRTGRRTERQPLALEGTAGSRGRYRQVTRPRPQ